MNSSKQQDLQTVIAAIHKKWGANAIKKGSVTQTRDRLSTGFSGLDTLLNGGIIRGGLTEIVGKPTSGMTTLALKLITSAQEVKDGVVYLDLASAFDPDSATYYGVNLAEMILVRDGFENVAELLYDIVVSGIPGLVVFNSLPLLSSEQQTLLTHVINRAIPTLTQSRCALVLLSLAVPARRSFISQYAALRLHTAFERWLIEDGQVQGYQTVVTVLKHKGGNEGRKAPLRIMFDDKMAEADS